MKRFDILRIYRMRDNQGGYFHYKPFPGKYPTRLFIRVYCTREDGRYLIRRGVEFKYHGKWSYPALLQAQEVWNKLRDRQAAEVLDIRAVVVEYCQTGILYSGTLREGRYSSAHQLAHLFSNATKQERSQRPLDIQDLVPFRCKDFVMMVPRKTVKAAVSPEQQAKLRNVMLQTRRKWEAV